MMLLTPEQKDKYDFCRTTLTELLRKALHNEHYRADYLRHRPSLGVRRGIFRQRVYHM